MEKSLKSLVALLALVVAAGALTACNTMGGLGEDIEDAGEGIQDQAN